MNISWKIATRSILSLGILFLVACSKKPVAKKEEIKEDPPSIVTTNFATGSLIKEIVGDSSIIVFDEIPTGTKITNWSPSAKKIAEINQTRPLVFIAGEPPRWITSLSQRIKVINVLPKDSKNFQVGSNPTQALAMLEKMKTEVTKTFPELAIKSNSEAYRNQLKSYEAKWKELPKTKKTPKGLNNGITRPIGIQNLISLIETNYDLLQKQVVQKSAHAQTFEGGIVPIIEKSCMECHDAISEEGDLNLEPFLTENAADLEPDLWEKVFRVIDMGQMPPPDYETQLNQDEKNQINTWIDSVLTKWDSGQMGADPGQTTIHRLNKNEYNYTIRDLFGLKIRPAANFPEENTGEGGFDNNADALVLPPLLMENYFESVSTIVEAVYSKSSSKSLYLSTKPSSQLPPDKAAEKVFKQWASFIYRKPADQQEIARLVALFSKEFETKKRYDEAMKMPLFSMLLSPNFLYRSTLTEIENKPYQIDDFELASKLSYFLWSSMPDRELFSLAAKGELQNPDVLEAQIERMLLDDKSKALGMHFGGQWFGWELLRSSANPDIEKYPEFDLKLRIALYQESTKFFNHLIEKDESAYQLIDSDYTFLNERLAKFYGIDGVTGNELRQVKLKDKNRGGILGMGSVLTATSLPLRSSPSIRGSFVIKDVLGINLPETPMDVEQLPEDDREIIGKTFRDTLEQHREDENCRSCHGMIDPIGFGLEAFDAIGRFRTRQNGAIIDTSGVMPDGTNFSTPADLKTAILKEKKLFVRNMVKKMLSYGLGRDLTAYDRPVIREITDKVIADQGSIRTAFIEVAKSYPFRNRRSDNFNSKTKQTESEHSRESEAKQEVKQPQPRQNRRRKNRRKKTQ